MQREKLYNLHKTASLIVAYFAFKTDKNFSDQTAMLLENITSKNPFFFYFIFLLPIQIVELFKLHLSSYFVFVYENILDCKKVK